MVMRIRYDNVTQMPQTLPVYPGTGNPIAFNDAGVAPDLMPGDRVYAAFIKEDIQAFKSAMASREASIANKGFYIDFVGHSGTMHTTLPRFDQAAFDAGAEVPLAKALIDAADCDLELLRQNSLFITDLSVVEDPARTYRLYEYPGNPPGPPSGNPWGCWTFGSLVHNMANPAATGVTAKVFLKEWVRQWTRDTIINGQTVAARPDVIAHLIGPWIRTARGLSKYYNIYDNNWESEWDLCTDSALRKFAPFKLTAIVNRIDLRGNAAYSGTLKNAGETRFIFTLLDPEYGTVPFEGDQAFPGTAAKRLDWEGMNVILEYSNVQNNLCDLRNFAQRWLDLSSFSSFGTAYNDSLEAVTAAVTTAGAGGALKPNGSALARIRTNERLFENVDPGGNEAGWFNSDWQFRQFEIHPTTHLLHQAPLTNTPVQGANALDNVVNTLNSDPYNTAVGTNDDAQDDLIDFAVTNKTKLASGNFNLPVFYPGTTTPLLAMTADVDGDRVHYWNFDWFTTTSSVYNISTLVTPDSAFATARHQLSLNTCQGCHAGENKTLFTQIAPRNYGEPAKYWTATPAHDTGFADGRHFTNTGWTTNASLGLFDSDPDTNYKFDPGVISPSGSSRRVFPVVSAFLTGRTYWGAVGAATFRDDNPSDDAYDNVLGRLFYVNDPANYGSQWTSGDNTIPGPQMRHGFNDLLLRFTHLCRLINGSCGVSKSVVLDVAVATTHRPFARASH